MKSLLFMLSLIFILNACAINPIRRSILPDELSQNTSSDYKMILSREGVSNSLILHVEQGPSRMAMVAFGALGVPLFSCFIEGKGSEYKQCEMIDSNIPAGKLFDDMMLILTPIDVLKTRLDDQFTVVETQGNKKITRNNSPFIDIVYTGLNDFSFTHHVYDYRFELQALNDDE